MYYNEEFETLPRPALEALQLKRLEHTLARVYNNVPFYRQALDKAGIIPESLSSLDELKKLPFTYKQDMRNSYPYGLFAAPMDDIVRIHASSGTTGKPTVVGYTRKDIDSWAELMARSFVAAGVHKGDIIHNAYGYGLFTGGLGAHYGAEKLGASVIPMSGGNTQRQIMIMQDFGSTVLTCTPSYSLFMAEAWAAANEAQVLLSRRDGEPPTSLAALHGLHQALFCLRANLASILSSHGFHFLAICWPTATDWSWTRLSK